MAKLANRSDNGRTVRNSPEVYAPTPQQIREACEEIQATWSDRERRKRSWINHPSSWLPPMVQQDFARTETGASRERSYNSLI